MAKDYDVSIILKVHIHCEGCENEVLSCLRGFEGVEVVEIDGKGNRVWVKGKGVDPMKVVDRVRMKTGKYVELISPLPKKQEEKDEEKALVPKVIEVVLKLYLHCEGCENDVKQCIHAMEGVQTVHADMKKNLMTVKGTMDPQKLVGFVSKKCGRHATIVDEVVVENCRCGCDREETIESKDRGENICYNYRLQPSAPQFFSDENPNSCSIM